MISLRSVIIAIAAASLLVLLPGCITVTTSKKPKVEPSTKPASPVHLSTNCTNEISFALRDCSQGYVVWQADSPLVLHISTGEPVRNEFHAFGDDVAAGLITCFVPPLMFIPDSISSKFTVDYSVEDSATKASLATGSIPTKTSGICFSWYLGRIGSMDSISKRIDKLYPVYVARSVMADLAPKLPDLDAASKRSQEDLRCIQEGESLTSRGDFEQAITAYGKLSQSEMRQQRINGVYEKWSGQLLRDQKYDLALATADKIDNVSRKTAAKDKVEAARRAEESQKQAVLSEQDRKHKEEETKKQREKAAQEEVERLQREADEYWAGVKPKIDAAEQNGDLKTAVGLLETAIGWKAGGDEASRRLAAIYASPGWKSVKTKVTIQKFDIAEGLAPTLGKFLYDCLLGEIAASTKYTVVDWEEVDRLLKYLATSQPNLTPEEARKQAISQLGVQQIYLGSVSKVGSKYYVTVKALNLDLSVANSAKESVNTEEELPDAITAISKKLL